MCLCVFVGLYLCVFVFVLCLFVYLFVCWWEKRCAMMLTCSCMHVKLWHTEALRDVRNDIKTRKGSCILGSGAH